MAFQRRKDIVDLSEVGIYACVSRCVRRGRLTGRDPGGLDLSHRRLWVLRRLQDLVTVFAVELLDYGVLDNSLHTLLRIRPDLTPNWSDEEVVKRWHRLNRQRLELNDTPLSRKKLRQLLKRKRRVQVWRGRLSDPSWFMIMLKEPLARAANREDQVSGHFFGERFSCEKCQTLEDTIQASLFANMTPVQAGMAVRPSEAEFTSFRDRLDDAEAGRQSQTGMSADERRAGWLAPLALAGDGFDGASTGCRPTNDGYLPFGLDVYSALLDVCRCGPRDEVDEYGGMPPATLQGGGATSADSVCPRDDQGRWRAMDVETASVLGASRQVILPEELPAELRGWGCDPKRWAEAYRRNVRRIDRVTRQTDELRRDYERAARRGGES